MFSLAVCLLLVVEFSARVFGLNFPTRGRRQSKGVSVDQNDTFIAAQNDRLSFTIDKTSGFLGHVHLDGMDLQGPQSNSSGRGYYECHCVPSGYQVDASDIYLVGKNSTFQILQGTDSVGSDYVGVFSQEILPIGHTFQQWYFLRPGETGIHNFARLIYSNSSAGLPFQDGGIPVREIREVFQFNTTLWQTASSNPSLNVTIPGQDSISKASEVQDATWSFQATPDEPFVRQTSDYWTKYFLADAYRHRKAHGLYGVDPSDGTAYGAWMVSLTQDTLFGGPTHYDLILDGLIGVPEKSANLQRIPHIYYYDSLTQLRMYKFASSHQGAATSNLTSLGYDRTWGPQILYFNKGQDSSLSDLRQDAENAANLDRFSDFYNSVVDHVPGFTPPSNRSSVSIDISLPKGASNAVAILSAEGFDFQSNVLDLSTYQYWQDISDNGSSVIRDVRPGAYRLTIYADGVFGSYVQDGVDVSSGSQTTLDNLTWTEESSGTEIWRLGVPDRSAGEYLHGFARLLNKTFHPQSYRQYWGAYNFSSDFPNGVNFKIGESDVSKDWNYAQFSEVGGDLLTPGNSTGDSQKNNFTVNFALSNDQLSTLGNSSLAALTVNLAGASGATGNEDFSNAKYANFPLNLKVNNQSENLQWIIPSNVSSSCVTRSGISCFFVRHQYKFNASWLTEGINFIELGLVPGSGTRVMYDALRLEIS